MKDMFKTYAGEFKKDEIQFLISIKDGDLNSVKQYIKDGIFDISKGKNYVTSLENNAIVIAAHSRKDDICAILIKDSEFLKDFLKNGQIQKNKHKKKKTPKP